MPKPYPPEFRRRARELVASGRTVVEVAHARDRGVVPVPVAFPRPRRPRPDRVGSAESAELAAAQRRIRELEDEVKILRKAAAAVEAVVE